MLFFVLFVDVMPPFPQRIIARFSDGVASPAPPSSPQGSLTSRMKRSTAFPSPISYHLILSLLKRLTVPYISNNHSVPCPKCPYQSPVYLYHYLKDYFALLHYYYIKTIHAPLFLKHYTLHTYHFHASLLPQV